MKKVSLLAGALLALAPAVALLPGCGGGNDGIVTPTGTAGPTPTYTSGPLPTETVTGTPNATPTRTARPTNTPVATSTPIPIGAVKANLTFTPSSDSNFKEIPTKSGNFNLRTYDNSNTLQFGAQSGSVNLEYVVLGGELPAAAQGNGYSANPADARPIRLENNVIENNQSRIRGFSFQSGTITVTRLSKSNATLSFSNVVFGAVAGPGGATGTVIVNGTISGPYTTNFA